MDPEALRIIGDGENILAVAVAEAPTLSVTVTTASPAGSVLVVGVLAPLFQAYV